MIRFLDIKKINDAYQPELIHAVQAVVDSGLFVRGEQVRRFENAYALYTGTHHCVGVGNGFDALRLIFKAWITMGRLKEGDEVLVPSNTYIASILSISDNRLRPVLVEPDPETCNVRADQWEAKITSRTRAIMVVHLYGRNAMDDGIKALASAHHLLIVEDNAQAAGCYWKQKRTGSLGDAAGHSFFPTKNLGALGDGGAVTTDDGELAGMIRALGNYGSAQKGLNRLQGVNSRLDELQAAVLNVKLPRLDADNALRRKWVRHYLNLIDHPQIRLPAPPSQPSEHVWHLFVLRCEERDHLQDHLRRSGIETLIHYPVPPHKQEAYASWNAMRLPVSEQIHREVISLPLSPVMQQDAITAIIAAVNAFSPPGRASQA